MATALPLPNLDDRRWTDLVDEGRALIPFYAPDWTDHNVHDPGIMLIELFAWLAEMDLFELNQITDAHRRKFLALAGIATYPIQAAESLLQLRLETGQPPRDLPAGLEFEGFDPFAAPVRFRSRHALTVQSGSIEAALTHDGTAFQNLTNAWKRAEPIQPFGADPGPGAAFYLGFKPTAAWPPDSALSLGFAVAQPGGKLSRSVRERIVAEATNAAEDCAPPADSCYEHTVPDDETTNDDAWFGLRHHSVRLVWEISTGTNRWTRLTPDEDVQDGTRSLTLSGRVVITPPEPMTTSTLGGQTDAFTWLRVRIVRGRHDATPVLAGIAYNAVEVIQTVPAIAHLRIAPGAPITGTPPAMGELIDPDFAVNAQGALIRLNFAAPQPDRPGVRLLAYDAAARLITLEVAAIARGSAEPSQEITIPDAPLVLDSLRVDSIEAGVPRAWSVRSDFEASKRADAHAIAEAETGLITFGDGEHGRATAPGSTLLITGHITRGAGGNLVAGAISKLADSFHNKALLTDLATLKTQLTGGITNVVPASGGSAAEPLQVAIARAQDERERAFRAVTLDDHVALAFETPGVRIARAEARANFHPGFPCLTAPGIVTLLIVPELPADRPEPTSGLLRAVTAYLNRRRVIGTRLEVAGPVYVPVVVRASVEARPGTPAASLQLAIIEALDRFFHPLWGGPGGTGWPFGRDVYRSEVLQVIDETPGVAHVLSLELSTEGGCPTCGNLCIGPTGLVDAGAHEIDVKRGGQ